MIVVGIDNGLDGGIVAIRDGVVVLKTAMPTLATSTTKRKKVRGKMKSVEVVGREYDLFQIRKLLKGLINSNERVYVWIERAQAMTKQGVTGMFNYGRSFGRMEGLCVGLDRPAGLVRPQEWQKVMFAGMKKENTKRMSFKKCQELWPNESWLATARSKVPHDGMTDAAMIAEYGRRQLLNERPTSREEDSKKF